MFLWQNHFLAPKEGKSEKQNKSEWKSFSLCWISEKCSIGSENYRCKFHENINAEFNFPKKKQKWSNVIFFSRLVGGTKIIDASDRRFYAFAMLSSDAARWRESRKQSWRVSCARSFSLDSLMDFYTGRSTQLSWDLLINIAIVIAQHYKQNIHIVRN